jgi:plasmid stabilization system protein ParE
LTVRLSRRADSDIRRLIRWLAQRSPDAADRAIGEIFRAIDLLERHPEAAPIVGPTTRQKVVHFGRDGFILLYRYRKGVVTIGRVKHGRQNR